MTVDSSPEPTPSEPVKANGFNAPAPVDGYTKYYSFTKSRRPRPSSSPSGPAPTSVVPVPIETPIPTPTPSTTLEAVGVTSPPPASKASSTAAPAPTAPAPSDNSFEAECLSAHNDKRALHGVSPLTYDSTMASFASGVSGTCEFKHSGGPYGENLAAGYPSPKEAIQAWYNEENQYDYKAGQFSVCVPFHL